MVGTLTVETLHATSLPLFRSSRMNFLLVSPFPRRANSENNSAGFKKQPRVSNDSSLMAAKYFFPVSLSSFFFLYFSASGSMIVLVWRCVFSLR